LNVSAQQGPQAAAQAQVSFSDLSPPPPFFGHAPRSTEGLQDIAERGFNSGLAAPEAGALQSPPPGEFRPSQQQQQEQSREQEEKPSSQSRRTSGETKAASDFVMQMALHTNGGT
jgi:hypothetical protein